MNENADTTDIRDGGATTMPPPPPTAPPPSRREPLRRSRTDRKIAGLAGGLGRHFDIDPLIIRILLVTLALFGGSGLLIYAVGWLLVPEEGEDESEASRLVNGRPTSRIVGAVLLGIVGLAFLGSFARTDYGFGGFAALVAVGVAVFLIARNDGGRPARRQPPAAGSSGEPGQFGQTTGTAYTSPMVSEHTQAAYGDPASRETAYGETAYAETAPTVPTPPPPPGPPVGRITASVALLSAAALLSWNMLTSHDVSAEALFATCLGVVGIGLLVGAFIGGSRWLILLGVVLMIATSVAAVFNGGLRGGIGERTWSPRAMENVHDTYRLGIGSGELDLSRLEISPGQDVDVRVRQGIGDLTIVLPPGVSADVDADVRAGVIRLPRGNDRSGTSVHWHYVDPAGTSDAVVTIDADLVVGQLEVRRATP